MSNPIHQKIPALRSSLNNKNEPEIFHRLVATTILVDVRSPCCDKLLYHGQVVGISQHLCKQCKKVVQVEPINEPGMRISVVTELNY